MGLQDDIKSLAASPALRDIEPEALRLIAFSAETRILRPGDILFRRGDRSDGGYLVLSGAVALDAEDGAPETIVQPPTLIGDSALIAETIRPCTAQATHPCSVMKITRSLFHRVLTEYPNSAVALRRSRSRRMKTMRDDLDTYDRLPR